MIALFRRRSRSTIGLDLGSGFVKAVEIDHSGPEPEVVRVACQPLLADAIVEGEVLDPPLVVDAIRSVMSGLDTAGKTVVTAVGGRDVIIKKIQMDRLPVDDAREVIRWEAEQYVPFDMESVQLDFQILDPDEEGLQMEVLLVAAKRELVDQKLMLLRDAGLNPEVVDVDAFALHNAFERNYPEAARAMVALVNIGHELTTVNVLQDGVPTVTRDIPFGTRHVREDLQRRHGLSADDAEAVVNGEADAEPYQAAFAERTQELAQGVERATAFLALNLPASERLGRIYLTGGGARLPTLQQAVADRLRAQVEVANPLHRVRVSAEAAADFPVADRSPMLMLPVGLALRTPL